MALALLCVLAACGSLPRPFEGNPGPSAERLLRPPPARLMVQSPTEAYLSPAAADMFAKAMAAALADKDVPAISAQASPGDWKLVLTMEVQGDQLLPIFKLFDEKGVQAGLSQGQLVDGRQWSSGNPAALNLVATSEAQSIADLLTRIEAARNASDPDSLVNRAAHVVVPDVTGAPGDGNVQLAKQMRTQLSQLGMVVQNGQGDFTVAGRVVAVPIAGQMTRIEIQWVVSNASGDERGRIVQLNEVPAGSLSQFWGDVAVVVAQEAAGGVKDVIARQTGAASK